MMNSNNIVLKYDSNFIQPIPILNLKSKEISDWTHKIILTVIYDGKNYNLQNSTIDVRRTHGRPKLTMTQHRGAPSKEYINYQSDTESINQLHSNIDNVTPSDPIVSIGREEINEYSF